MLFFFAMVLIYWGEFIRHYESAHALLAELLHTSTKTVEGKIVYKRGTPRWDEAIQLSEIIHLRVLLPPKKDY